MSPNRILIVGVLNNPSSTNLAMKRGFEACGYEVDGYDYRAIGSYEPTNRDFKNLIDGLCNGYYELIVFCKVNGMDPVLLDYAKKVAPTWYWFMDPMSTAKGMHASVYAQNATFASATSSEVFERFALINKNAHHLIEGFDTDVYFYEDLPKTHDILFIGNATPQRVSIIATLRKIGFRVSVFGSGWPTHTDNSGPVCLSDERTEINQAKWVLNLCQDEFIFSDRVTKALACGANVISNRSKDIVDVYNGYIRIFKSFSEFMSIIEKGGRSANFSKDLSLTMHDFYSWKSTAIHIMGVVHEYTNGKS